MQSDCLLLYKKSVLTYRRLWLLSACAYNARSQSIMRLTNRCAYTGVRPRPLLHDHVTNSRFNVLNSSQLDGQQRYERWRFVKGECDTRSPCIQERLDSTSRRNSSGQTRSGKFTQQASSCAAAERSSCGSCSNRIPESSGIFSPIKEPFRDATISRSSVV